MAVQIPLAIVNGQVQRFAAGDYVDIANGGTGATTASGARTALGLAIGSDVQAWDADLDAIAAFSGTGFAARTGSNAWSQRTLQAPAAGFTISNPAGVAGDPTFALANDLAALEGLASTGFAVRTGSDAWTQRSIAVSSTARLTVTNGNGVSGDPTLDLATLTDSATGTFLKITRDSYGRVSGTTAVVTADITALVDATYVNVNGDTMTNFLTLHADPTSALHAATKQYVDLVASGYTAKTTVRAATTASIATLGGGAPNTLDGVTLAANDRILVKDQGTGSQNGIYVVTTLGTGSNGTWTRATDYDTSAEVNPGLFVFVSEGTANGNNGYTLTTDAPITLGTTALVFTQTSGAGQITAGAGLTKTGNTLDIGTASTSRIVINADDIDLATVTDAGTGTFLKFTRDSYGRVSGTTAVVAADITALLDSDLTAIANLATTGLIARTGTGTMATRTITQPAAGITVTNGDGVSGNPTLALANDLSALEGLASTGIAVRTGTDTWAQRSVATASSARITVTNGDGVSGNITLDLASGVISTPGTYNSVTVDTYGRVTAGSTSSTTSLADTLTNGEAGAIVIGRVVYCSGVDTMRLANANAAGTKDVIGIVTSTSISSGASGSFACEGIITATTTQWDVVTGQSGGLTTGAKYYLSNTTAGAMTTTAPSSGYVCLVGIALSTTKFRILIGTSVGL